MSEQKREQLEGPGREPDRPAGHRELAGVGVEVALAEVNPHRASVNQDSRNNPATPRPPDGRSSTRRSSLSPVALGQAAPVWSRSWVVWEDGRDLFVPGARGSRWPRRRRPPPPRRSGSRTIG